MFQVVSHIKAVLSASSHVIGTKDLDAGKKDSMAHGLLAAQIRSKRCFCLSDGQDTLLLFLRNLAQHHSREFQCAVMSLPSERKAVLVALVTPA